MAISREGHLTATFSPDGRGSSASEDTGKIDPVGKENSEPEENESNGGSTSLRLWIERIELNGFRSYAHAVVTAAAVPQVLFGGNGEGKTNFLEAISLLAPGQGLRRAPFSELGRSATGGKTVSGWSVAGRVHTALGTIDIGTGLAPATGTSDRSARIVRIDGEPQSGSGVLADYVEMVWVTPAMDGLFTGPASERRRFLDRLILCFDAGYRTRVNRFEKAMQSRNRLLADGVRDHALIEGFEITLAESGVAIAAQRAEAVASLAQIVAARRRRDPHSLFPWAELAIEGTLESALADHPAVDVEERYLAELKATRERDRAAGRTLSGPHRSDLVVGHGPKAMPARLSSTGEQKALLIGLVLAHAELVAERQGGVVPILLLDEVTAHFDTDRRAALFAEIRRIGAQAWMTGTDRVAFAALDGHAQFHVVADGRVTAA